MIFIGRWGWLERKKVGIEWKKGEININKDIVY
jgi:hypothetical protein